MSLEKFTRVNGESIFINADMVIAIYPSVKDNNTIVACLGDSTYAIREPADHVVTQIRISQALSKR